eukprot:3981469-Pleurochrysis_carterae.AAC.2
MPEPSPLKSLRFKSRSSGVDSHAKARVHPDSPPKVFNVSAVPDSALYTIELSRNGLKRDQKEAKNSSGAEVQDDSAKYGSPRQKHKITDSLISPTTGPGKTEVNSEDPDARSMRSGCSTAASKQSMGEVSARARSRMSTFSGTKGSAYALEQRAPGLRGLAQFFRQLLGLSGVKEVLRFIDAVVGSLHLILVP